MEHVVLSFLLASAVILTAATVISGERVNETSATAELVWSKGKLESDLLSKPEPGNSDYLSAGADVDDHDDLDGGFSSLDGVLRWAIGHSDPAKLKESAEDVQRLSASELQKRQLEIKELIEKMNMPSDAQLMQIAIDDLNNSSSSLEDRQRALQELLILVEPLDNANDLNKLGGLAIVIQELNHPDPDIRRLSAWVLGKACQNNPVVQKQEILSNSSSDIRLHRKAVFLVADLVECQLENLARAESPFFRNRFFLKSVVDLTASTDLDLQEKALVAIKNLLQLKTTEALIFKDFCDLNGSLVRMRQQLLDLMASEDHRDYAVDLENLRREVELIFHEKLGKVMKVPTRRDISAPMQFL
ncbi:hsp70 nucleotide exchange factor FES1 isoform X3 [Populus alba]|uniref:Nucleotide exchange factor SIL1-like isoform X2 n=1 Tax=Populus alba x Populus x berolinensis TaxID=444605 RepID=A0AAD6R910_9ROSI|nr:nucleotide exchange factor SIL1-like isoform X2 [Populus alba]KAJ7004484.1 nucleotide exchange factor SIL1-like isoform X2 [Populus alba x Populus x berolinensis]